MTVSSVLRRLATPSDGPSRRCTHWDATMPRLKKQEKPSETSGVTRIQSVQALARSLRRRSVPFLRTIGMTRYWTTSPSRVEKSTQEYFWTGHTVEGLLSPFFHFVCSKPIQVGRISGARSFSFFSMAKPRQSLMAAAGRHSRKTSSPLWYALTGNDMTARVPRPEWCASGRERYGERVRRRISTPRRFPATWTRTGSSRLPLSAQSADRARVTEHAVAVPRQP